MKWIFLDAGNTLVELNAERIAECAAEVEVIISADAFPEAEARARRELDRRELIESSNDMDRFAIYFGRILELLGVDHDDARRPAVERLREEHAVKNLWDRVEPYVPEVLDELAAAGRKRVVISNAQGDVPDLLDRVGLAPKIDRIIDSGLHGVEKPDPGIFEIAFEQVGYEPGEPAVYVGDFYWIDVIPARKIGLEAILLDPFDLNRDRDCLRLPDLSHLPAWLDEYSGPSS